MQGNKNKELKYPIKKDAIIAIIKAIVIRTIRISVFLKKILFFLLGNKESVEINIIIKDIMLITSIKNAAPIAACRIINFMKFIC